MNNRLVVRDEVKFREWQFGKLIAVDGDSAEVLMSNGTKIIKNND